MPKRGRVADRRDETARTVLVVDDLPIVRTFARVILEQAGFRVVEAEDGADAMTICGSAMPDAILLDRNMPNMDGEAFLSTLRLRPDGDRPRVLLCTTTHFPDPDAYVSRVGADAIVEKPFGQAHLMAKLRHVGLLAAGGRT